MVINKDTKIITSQYLELVLECPTKDAYEFLITVKKIEPIILTENYDNTAATYTGTGWTHSTENTCCGWYGNSLSYSNVIGNSINFTFTGKKIEWFSERKTTHGRAFVSIDGGTETPVNPGESNAGLGILYSSEVSPGQHTIRIRIRDSKFVVHDYFRVTK
jgi:hypothetical protein